MRTVLLGLCIGAALVANAMADARSYDSYARGSHSSAETAADQAQWCPFNLLAGPAAIVKGVGASVWCIGSMTGHLFGDVQSVGEGVTSVLLWPVAVVADSVVSTVGYEVVGLAHTLSFGYLVSDPPKPIEDTTGPIYCVLSSGAQPPAS